MESFSIVWSNQAKNAVKNIYNYYRKKSLAGAKNVIADLLKAPKSVHFAQQFQKDEINPKYRRIVVRDYKVLYLEKDNVIQVIDEISTKQSPEYLKLK